MCNSNLAILDKYLPNALVSTIHSIVESRNTVQAQTLLSITLSIHIYKRTVLLSLVNVYMFLKHIKQHIYATSCVTHDYFDLIQYKPVVSDC